MSKKIRVGIDLKCNVDEGSELFDLTSFSGYDFYGELSDKNTKRTKAYNILAGNQNMLKNAEFGDTWENINREVLRHVNLFVDKVYNQNHEDIEIELAEIDIQPLSVNAHLTEFHNANCLTFNADVVVQTTFSVNLTHPYDAAAVAASVADALELYIRRELDYAAETLISFIVR